MDAREQIAGLAVVLKARWGRDACGDPCIQGRCAQYIENTIHADGDTWLVTVSRGSGRGWANAKAALGQFMRLVQDGDREGTFRLSHMPATEEAALIRKWCGIRKVKAVSEKELARLRSISPFCKRAVEAENRAEGGPGGVSCQKP